MTCTTKLQEWNKPRPKKVEIIPVHELDARRESIVTKTEQSAASKLPATSTCCGYNPIPISLRPSTADSATLLENLRTDMLKFNSSCGLLQLLAPPVEIALHDHDYTTCHYCSDVHSTTITTTVLHETDCLHVPLLERSVSFDKKVLNVTPEDRHRIEGKTRSQSQSLLWHAERARRITASRCGKILGQRWNEALLGSVLYPKPFKNIPPPIQWGVEKEKIALKEYVSVMRSNGHTNLTAEACGFIIHPTQGWLGASPDGVVTDPSAVGQEIGILEIKCPYSKRDLHPNEACKDDCFYCTMYDNTLQLKRDHQYYHQVQLQCEEAETLGITSLT